MLSAGISAAGPQEAALLWAVGVDRPGIPPSWVLAAPTSQSDRPPGPRSWEGTGVMATATGKTGGPGTAPGTPARPKPSRCPALESAAADSGTPTDLSPRGLESAWGDQGWAQLLTLPTKHRQGSCAFRMTVLHPRRARRPPLHYNLFPEVRPL